MPGHSSPAIQASGLVKRYGTDVIALDGSRHRGRGGFDLRLARAERRRQVDDGQDPHHARPSPTTAPRRSPGVDVAPRARTGSAPDRRGRSADRRRSGRHGSREPGAAGPALRLSARQELRRRIDELLERFGLTEAADRMARTYSGGMQRKLDVAMGLVHRPRVLFLDEPTTGLDPEARAELWAEIARLTRQRRADHPADDALPRGGRSPGESPRDRRPRPRRRQRHARRAQGGAPGRCRATSSCDDAEASRRGSGSAGRRRAAWRARASTVAAAGPRRARRLGGAGRRRRPWSAPASRSPR